MTTRHLDPRKGRAFETIFQQMSRQLSINSLKIVLFLAAQDLLNFVEYFVSMPQESEGWGRRRFPACLLASHTLKRVTSTNIIQHQSMVNTSIGHSLIDEGPVWGFFVAFFGIHIGWKIDEPNQSKSHECREKPLAGV